MKMNLALLAVAALSIAVCGCPKREDVPTNTGGGGTGTMPGASPGIPWKQCVSDGQCSDNDYKLSMFGGNASFANDYCKGGWCRAVLVNSRQCGVANDTVTCEKSRGVTGTSTCSGGLWGPCN
jgi:hypothetical protein